MMAFKGTHESAKLKLKAISSPKQLLFAIVPDILPHQCITDTVDPKT
jgi:hypothetical protein